MAGEKRTQDQEETLLSETVVLVDIEGTTTSISFVKETLFPYVRENLKKYIETKWEDEEFKKDFEKLKEQAKKDEEDKVDGFVSITGANKEEEKESLVKNILWQMDGDRKTSALKQLQGHMWREAYESGAVKGHVYEDVPKALESWTNDGRKVYVYSSGSVEAQKLLFGHSVCGDLLKYFSGYFDTEVGAKQEASSYKNILSKIGVEASSVIFLTDVVKEAAAAKKAGLSTVIVLREGNAALTDEERVAFTTIKSFLDLTFQTSTKRQKLETAEPQKASSKSTTDITEPMDTSEDVEMSDVSEKKVEKAETKEVADAEAAENTKNQVQEEVKASAVKTDEPMVTDAKDGPIAEKVTDSEAAEKSESESKLLEVSKKLDSDENVQPTVTDNTETALTLPESDTDKTAVSESVEKPAEQTEKKTEPAAVETTPLANSPANAEENEPKSKSEQAPSTEKSTDESNTETPTETKVESTAVTDTKLVEDGTQKKNTTNSTENKTEECAKPDKEEAKEQPASATVTNSSAVERKKSECEESPVKTTEESKKTEETPAADVTENGDVSQANVEKATAPTIAESEATSSKTDAHVEVKDTPETTAETKLETELQTTDDKSPKAKETEEVIAAVNDTEKHETSVETAKEEPKEESVKEETVVDEVKDKNTVDSEKKKLNGTTQNGDTDVPVSDDKLHRNGLNEGSSNDKLNSTASKMENTSAQNGEPESSSEASAESIKVKKVVDSTIADGAGEPDVVPPVVVAATS